MIYDLGNGYDLTKFKDRITTLINERATVDLTKKESESLSFSKCLPASNTWFFWC